MICDYSNSCTSVVPFLRRKLKEEVPMRLTRYLNCTPSRLFGKYSELVSLGVQIPKNLNVIKPLPRHRLGMKNKKAITEEWVSQKWLSHKLPSVGGLCGECIGARKRRTDLRDRLQILYPIQFPRLKQDLLRTK
jgi:hypothetical protein